MDPKLYEAVSSGDYNNFLSLINADPPLLLQTSAQKNTALHLAASFNQKTIAEEITRRHPLMLYEMNSKEDTALHLAARLGRLELVEHLIGCSATRRRNGDDVEANGQYKELMRMVNLKEDTALHDAVRNGHGQIAKLLVVKCPALAAKANKSGESPLFVAVEKDYLEIAREILRVESNCCLYGGRDGANVLHAIAIRTIKRYTNSCFNNSFIVPWILLLRYFGHDQQDAFRGKKIIELSSTHKDFAVELLDKFPEIIREADNYGWLPLHYAANLGSEEVVELILKKEPSVTYEKDKDGMSALHIAAKEGHVGVLKTIVRLCPDSCELLDVKDRTALHVAAAHGKWNVVCTMLAMPCFMNMANQEDIDGNTPLHLSAINGDSFLVRMLAANKRVAKNMINNQGLTTNDIVGLSPWINFYGKFTSIKVLERNGALLGMHQVLGRKQKLLLLVEREKRREEEEEEEEEEEVKRKKAVADETRSWKSERNVDVWGDWSNANLMVATIIAAATFSTAFQVPGGYDENGMAVLREKDSFRKYLLHTAVSFGLAVGSILVTISVGFSGGTKYVFPRQTAIAMTVGSLFFMAISFLSGICSVVEEGFSNRLLLLFAFHFEFPLLATCLRMLKLAFARSRIWRKNI